MLESSKAAFPVVSVQGGHLVGEIRARDVEPAIRVEVSYGDSHARLGHTILIKSATGRNRDFPEGSVMIVAVEQAGALSQAT